MLKQILGGTAAFGLVVAFMTGAASAACRGRPERPGVGADRSVRTAL